MMEKLSKALGVGSRGSVRFELDRASYEPGDTVFGTVHLSVYRDFKTNGGAVCCLVSSIVLCQSPLTSHLSTCLSVCLSVYLDVL